MDPLLDETIKSVDLHSLLNWYIECPEHLTVGKVFVCLYFVILHLLCSNSSYH